MPSTARRKLVGLVLIVSTCFTLSLGNSDVTNQQSQVSEHMPLPSILPKIDAIHEEAKSLLTKNQELKANILAGLLRQNSAKTNGTKAEKTREVNTLAKPSEQMYNGRLQVIVKNSTVPMLKTSNRQIDFAELAEFNKWVETNLNYAVMNTQASAEALKEEALLNNGTVDYSEQAIRDGIEGVKYWQSTVIFQDKTLKNEKFDQLD